MAVSCVFVKLEELLFCFVLMRSLLKLLTSLCSLAFIFAASAHQPAQGALESKQKPLTVTIAVADSLEAVTDDRSIEETINSLKQKLSSFFDIRKVSFLSADAKNFVAENKPDFVIATTGSSPFFSETADGSYRIATRKNPATEIASQSIGSTVVALKSRTDINSFDDLKGKTIAATLPVSVSGWLAFAGEVVDLGQDPRHFFKQTLFLNTLFPTLTAALWGGRADAVVLPACFLETLESSALADVSQIKVLNEKSTDVLHCRHSTALYPDVSFYGFRWTDESAARALTIALLSMTAETSTFEWRSNVAADSIDALFRKLEIGQYSFDKHFSLSRFYARFKREILIGLFLVLLLIGHGLVLQHLVKKRTAELSCALERQQRAEALARENRSRLGTLERRNIVNQMSGMIAHEIRSPVGAVMNFKAILDVVLPESIKKEQTVSAALSGIASETRKIAGIVDRVRNYAKSQKSAQKPCRLTAIVDKAIESVKAAAEVEIRIVKHFDCPEDKVLGDALELELLAVNLIKNAWQAQAPDAHPKVSISIDVCEQALAHRTDRSAHSRNAVVLTVSNPGKKLSDEEFARLSTIAESIKPEGLGMGLSIVRGICDSHAATLNFQRNPSGGVSVRVSFPALQDEQS